MPSNGAPPAEFVRRVRRIARLADARARYDYDERKETTTKTGELLRPVYSRAHGCEAGWAEQMIHEEVTSLWRWCKRYL